MIVYESRSEPHTIVVNTNVDDDIGVKHPTTCPTKHDEDFGTVYTCDVEEQLHTLGMKYFFAHQDDPEIDPLWAQPLAPGTYQFVAWYTTTEDLNGREHDEGLELVQ